MGNYTDPCPINRPPQPNEAARQAHLSISTNGVQSSKTACKLSWKHSAGSGPKGPRGCMRKRFWAHSGWYSKYDIILVIGHLMFVTGHYVDFFGEDPSRFHSNPSAGPKIFLLGNSTPPNLRIIPRIPLGSPATVMARISKSICTLHALHAPLSPS